MFAGIKQHTTFEDPVEPPDAFVAAGPDTIVEVVNRLVWMSDRYDNFPSLIPIKLPTFFLLPNDGSTSDTAPRVLYDPAHNRWVVTEASWDCVPGAPGGATVGHGYLDVAISNNEDAHGDWTVYSVAYPDQFPDLPALGTSTDKVVLSSNVYEMVAGTGLDCIGPTLQGADITTFDWSDLVNGGGLSYNHIPPLANSVTLRTSIQSPATSPSVYFVALVDTGASGVQVDAGAVTGTVAGHNVGFVDDLLDDLIAPPVTPLPQPREPGTPSTISEGVDERITDAIWQADKLTWVAAYPCTPTGDSTTRDCVRVTQFDTSGNRALLQDFLVAANGEDLYMGGVGVTGNGALHVVWTQSSGTAGDRPSAHTAYQLPSDPPNTLSAVQGLRSGIADYSGMRWGQYVAVAQDPQDADAVWAAVESADSNGWGTNFAQLDTAAGSTYVPIDPVRVLNTTTGVGLTGPFHSGVPRTFQVAGMLGIPADASAITANVAVTGQTGAGYVSVTLRPIATPSTSTINFPIGDVRANNLTTRLSPTGTLSAVYRSGAGTTTHVVLDVTGYFLKDTSGATYAPVAPVRMLNTISGTGLTGKFIHAVPRTFQVAGVLGIPANAIAITGNLAVTGQSAAGFVSVTPDPIAAPSTSTINFPIKDVRANGLTVRLSATGSLSAVYRAKAGATTDLVLDVSGYYVQDLSGLRFYPLNPGRRLNTISGGSGVHQFDGGQPQTAKMAGHEGVPLFGPSAITGNLAILGQQQAGYVSITPDPTSTPSTSTINFPLGDVRANGVTVPLNGSGNISIVYKAGPTTWTQLVLDVTGYFK